MQDYLDVLKREFAAEEGSFLLSLRCDFVWDREAFSRLTDAMLQCCQAFDKSKVDHSASLDEHYAEQVPRWLAEGFWFLADFVKGHSSHPNFQRPFPAEYYEAAYTRLWDLAYWFFIGSSPYLPGHTWAPL